MSKIIYNFQWPAWNSQKVIKHCTYMKLTVYLAKGNFTCLHFKINKIFTLFIVWKKILPRHIPLTNAEIKLKAFPCINFINPYCITYITDSKILDYGAKYPKATLSCRSYLQILNSFANMITEPNCLLFTQESPTH